MRRVRLELVNSNARRHGGARDVGRQSGVLLLVLLAVAVTLGVLHNRWRLQKRPDPILAGVQLLTYPFQASGATFEAGIFSNWNALFHARRIEADNVRLAAENSDLRQANEKLSLQAAEAVRLEAALKLVKNLPKPPLAATVVALLPSPDHDTITVNRGAREGVEEGTIARTPAGLVGQVADASAFSASVMLLTDLNSAVGGIVQRSGKSLGVGVVQGTGRGQMLEMIDLKRDDDVRPGDTVVSSGYGGVFPPDIPIGVVQTVKSDDARFLKSATVVPAVRLPGDLREVYLLSQ